APLYRDGAPRRHRGSARRDGLRLSRRYGRGLLPEPAEGCDRAHAHAPRLHGGPGADVHRVAVADPSHAALDGRDVLRDVSVPAGALPPGEPRAAHARVLPDRPARRHLQRRPDADRVPGAPSRVRGVTADEGGEVLTWIDRARG